MQDRLKNLIKRLVEIQALFLKEFGVGDIYSNSKIFEILIADGLNHKLIPGHSGSRDALDSAGEYEYKHFKESSSNHSWTFNDFTDSTIKKLKSCSYVIFAHINDSHIPVKFDWYYKVPGSKMSKYLSRVTVKIKNTRKMVNVSPGQIESVLHIKKSYPDPKLSKKIYEAYLTEIFQIALDMEKIVGTHEILTSNKLWEILVSLHTGHKILSEQKKHDAIDELGNYYEYKVSIGFGWQFQDISASVLRKYLDEKAIILVIVDKSSMNVIKIFSAEPVEVVKLLKTGHLIIEI